MGTAGRDIGQVQDGCTVHICGVCDIVHCQSLARRPLTSARQSERINSCLKSFGGLLGRGWLCGRRYSRLHYSRKKPFYMRLKALFYCCFLLTVKSEEKKRQKLQGKWQWVGIPPSTECQPHFVDRIGPPIGEDARKILDAMNLPGNMTG